ncbi:MAG: hypothetical protein KF795_05350 [Labilithrix sp.]|nr:hypothetical protein [Labilithrix sp.]
MPREVDQERRRDDKLLALKRRVRALAQLDGEVVRLAEGPCLVRARQPRSAKAIVQHLRSRGALDRATLEKNFKLEAPPVAVDARTVAAAHRDLALLSQRPLLTLAAEHRRALARYGTIDEAWLRDRRERVERLASALVAGHSGEPIATPATWFDRVVELVRATRGDRDASALASAAGRVRARASERRAEARGRVDALAASLRSGAAPTDPELAELTERLDAARELPGRARRRRVLDVLRRAARWPDAPADLLAAALGAHQVGDDYADLIEEAGRAMASSLPVVRDPSLREASLELLAELGLVFPIGDDGVPLDGDDGEAPRLLQRLPEVLELAPSGLSLAKALALAKIPMDRPARKKIALWVKEGLELDLVAEAAEKKHVANLARVGDVRAARAYATWATRLSAHYESQGITFSLPPELFVNLPANEDLAVLAMCLMEHVDPKSEGSAPADPIAVLDATLALFKKLPAKARGILGSLRGTEAGEGRRQHPELARWLDDDALLDRLAHVARLAGEAALPRAIREDFEHAERTRGERAHLEKLATRSPPQQGRLDALSRGERTLAGSPRGRTRRRIAERIEQLLPAAYRRELDATFREILRDAWGISAPALTPAWRDAVRFWLIVDDNRTLLGQLLKAASLAPGRDVKRSFPQNHAWIDANRARLDIEAWLAPRRREIVVPRDAASPAAEPKSARFVLELEEDPLEVLRMGMPFGTCLALDSGCNAASTVLNAIDANKRVLYVRNANGRVVARKLLAISKDARLIGYNLYVSVRGAEERAIRAAVRETCCELARDTGAPLAATGEPAELHEGFWYDDGTVPFDEDVDVAAYTRSLGLPPPPKGYETLGKEAQAWKACETGDVDSALGVLSAYDTGAANRGLGRWIVERLGPRAAEKRAADDSSVFVALARALADEGEYGMLRALDLAVRMPEPIAHHRLSPLLARFPPSPKLGVALVDIGLRAMKRHARTTDHGLAHLTLSELPATFDDVAGALDLLDSVEPAWLHVTRALPSCEGCVATAVECSADVVETIYDRAPDSDVVVAALMSRHRTATAQRAALRVAARHVLPNGDRALTRLATLRPELAASPDGIAALVRQARIDRVTEAIARRAPRPSSPPFEALRDLVLTCADLELVLGETARVADIDAWAPGPWELAWRRRRSDPELRDGLFARAARAPRTVTRAMEQLALLADLKRLGALEHVKPRAATSHAPRAAKADAATHASLRACRATATSLADQVAASERGRVDPDVGTTPHADAGYVDLARRALEDESGGEASRDAARDVVLRCDARGVVDFERLLASSVRERLDAKTAIRILEERPRSSLPPRIVVDAWQLEEVRDALVRTIAARSGPHWCARVWAAEREAKARGLSVEGLLERTALRILEAHDVEDAIEAETLDQLRSIASALAADAAAADLARLYVELDDTPTVAMLLRAVRRQPLTRRAEFREAVGKLELDGDRRRALAAWLEVTRPSEAERSATPEPPPLHAADSAVEPAPRVVTTSS